jgi:DNA-binding MarR family transcriptional regulator
LSSEVCFDSFYTGNYNNSSKLNNIILNQNPDILDAVINDAYRAMHLLRHELVGRSERNLVHHHLAILSILAQTDGMSSTDIATKLSLTKPQITQFIARLVDEHAVTRASDSKDRRRVLISITPTGHVILSKYLAVVRDSMRKKLGKLNAADIENLSRALRSINSLADKLE